MKNNKTRKSNKKMPKIIIGKIYANWCGHCTALKPEWDKMKSEIKNLPIEIVEIEESEKDRLSAFTEKYKIQVDGYPTIFKITNTTEYYHGPPEAEAIKTWALSDSKMMGGKQRRSKYGKTRKYIRRHK